MKRIQRIFLLLIALSLLAFALSSCAIPGMETAKSAYDVAVENGFVGSEQEWLDSLKGKDGEDGDSKSAYDIAVENGFVGNEQEWLDSLKGKDGNVLEAKSAYDIAVENGYVGTEREWLDSLVGKNGLGITNVTVDYMGRVTVTLEDGTVYEIEVTDTSCTHDYDVVVTTPKCATEGYTTYTCKNCNHTYINNRVEPKGHHYVDGACLFCLEAVPYEGPEKDTEWYTSDGVSFVISNAKELAGLAYLVNSGNTMAGKKISLSSDVDLNGIEWIPIGTAEFPFAGELDGKNLTVSNLTISTDTSNVGLFGYVTGTVKRLNVLNANVTVTGSNENIGIVIGYSKQPVDGCSASGYLTAEESDCVGGIVGNSGAGVINSTNSAQIKGDFCVGGVVGKSSGVIHTNANSGNVTARNDVGGICGHFNAEGTCHTLTNTGNVSAKHTVGGIIGYAALSATLKDSSSSASIIGEYRVGGLVGNAPKLTISVCQNAGSTVSATGYYTHSDYIEASVGGYAGNAYTVEKCENSVAISYNSLGNYVGGIAGILYGSASDCVNNAEISATRNFVGGIAGRIDRNVNNCTNSGDISGKEKVGGIAGYVNSTGSQTISYITNSGTVTGEIDVGGLVGRLYHYSNNYNATYVITIFENINNGNISGKESVGGLYGSFSADNVGLRDYAGTSNDIHGYAKATVYRVVNSGNISGTSSVGEVFGAFWTDATSTLSEYVVVNSVNIDGTPKTENTLAGSSTRLTVK